MTGIMNTILYIRKHVFDVSQSEFATIAGVKQSTVCRWEKDELFPSLDEMRAIRAEALARKKRWKDRWFFEAEGEAA